MLAFEKKFLEHCQKRKFFEKGERVLVAFSGGADSTALLHLLLAVRPVLKVELGAAHCNFQLRARASLLDERFCQKTCASHGIPFFVERFATAEIAKAQKTSIEETARNLRYDFFQRVMQEHGYDTLVTAHQANDNAETVLFNLFRGASLLGLGGIPERRAHILRPLLPFERYELLQYLHARHLPYRIDRSNFDIDYDRNFIRHKVIPLLEQRFEHKLVPSLLRLSQNAAELSEFVEHHIETLLRKKGLSLSHNAFEVKTLQKLTLFEQKELFKRALKKFGLSPTAQQLQSLTNLLCLQSGRKVVINSKLEVIRKGTHIYFVEKAAGEDPAR
ncbi:MAG: tRNA lysidine(34) synthetase TilS [Chloroherpetonaceae bacterium]|nr:tRNA lysidine(34) synthetase TilS [Chloroherpetonaceae bacterium]MDW8467107.1 tRNA lysidine(34) synthetase TilS [Chloroherpetonaceae bacterium]